MTIAHLSDTHLGYSAFGRQKMVPDPTFPEVSVRQQEADLMQGLRLAIDEILKRRPDLVLHTGDLFDSAQPNPRTIGFAVRQFERLSEAGIPVVILEGDHSCPRAPRDGHVLALFDRLPGIHISYGEHRSFKFGDVTVHAVSHQTLFKEGLPSRNALGSGGEHILATHGVADGQRFFKTGRAACEVPVRECAANYMYIALGHCHRFVQVGGTDNAFYAGSTAPVVLNDFLSCKKWGFNWIDLSSRTPVSEHVPISSRPVNLYGLHDASGLTASQILSFLSNQASALPPQDAYCCLIVEELDSLVRRDLAMPALEEIFRNYGGLSVQLRLRDQKVSPSAWGEMAFAEQFDKLVAAGEGDEAFKSEVRDLGQSFLRSALQKLGSDEAQVMGA